MTDANAQFFPNIGIKERNSFLSSTAQDATPPLAPAHKENAAALRSGRGFPDLFERILPDLLAHLLQIFRKSHLIVRVVLIQLDSSGIHVDRSERLC